MSIVNNTTIYIVDLDRSKVTVDDVYFCFILTVPFRFRVASPYHCRFESQGNGYDIWIRNQPVTTPDSESGLLTLARSGGNLADLWSAVAIIPHKGRITSDELMIVLDSLGKSGAVQLDSKNKQMFPAMQALNTFIIGYHTATGEMWGGHPLQPMTPNEYMTRLRWEVTVVGMPLDFWTPETVGMLFDLKADKELHSVAHVTGYLTDLPGEKLAGIGAAIESLNRFYFYELAFEAKAKMVASDYKGALLMAVAALEGVHSAYVSHALSKRLPPDRTGDDKDLEDNYLRELGFSLCNKLTPYLFMGETERPSQELIQQVANAVKYRNEIMHALRNSAGNYRIRNRTNGELSDAFSAALRMFDMYREKFEKLLS